MKIIIIGGLPASGKTHLCENIRKKNNIEHYNIIHLDEYNNMDKEVLSSMILSILSKDIKSKEYIIEGLLTTNKDIIFFLDILRRDKNIKNVEIIWFKENREQCLINDNYRLDRILNSKNTISNIPYDNIDKSIVNTYKDNFKIIIKEKNVYIMESYKKFAQKYDIKLSKKPSFYHYEGIGDERYLVGNESWNLYGTGRNCWGDSWEIEKESPVQFIELYTLLDKVCPNINIIKLKILEAKLDINSAIDIAEFDNGDYYSSITSAYNICDIEKLYKVLVEEEIIEEIIEEIN